MLKRVISLILSLVMILGMMPINITAAAEEIPAEDLSVAETTAPTEEETVPTEAEPEETVPEETFAEIAGTIPEETAPVYLASSTGAGTCGATMFWSVDENGLLSIWGRGAMDDYSFTAASYAPWYEYRSYVKTVSISDTVTSIGNQAFNSCYNLTSIVIPASVTDVGERAFLGCSKLKTITFEGDVPSLTYAFYDISAIIYFPANNATWTEDIFQNYGGRIAWASTGEDTIVARGMWGAYNSNDIRWVLRDNGTLTFTGTGSMYETNQRPAWDFFDSQIKKVVVNTGITSVCDDAFAGCANLTEVSLPASLTSIGDSAFSGCTAITSVVVPEGVKKIGEGAFASCSKLTDISLPNTLTSIGNYAFSYCTSLTEIDLPESLTEIEYGAFANCPGLKKVSIPKGVTYIDSYIVRECPNLETFELWYTVDLIDYDAFWKCPALRTIIFHGTPAQWNAVEKDSTVTSVLNSQNVYIQYVDPCVNGHTEVIDKKVAATCTANGKTEGKHCSVCGKVLVAQQVIPAGHDLVNDICQRCGIITGTYGENLTWTLDTEGTVTISGTGPMTDYSSSSYYTYWDSVKTVIIENGVTSIGVGAFYYCPSLTSVEIPDSVTTIGDQAFYYCTSLTSVEIPDSVTSIGLDAFAFCTSLTEILVDEENRFYSHSEDGVLFNKGKTELLCYPGGKAGAYTIPDSVTSIGHSAFRSCRSLTSVEIPDSVTSIGDYAFHSCRSLTSMEIPDSVTSIGHSAFAYCDSLTSVEISDSVTSIGQFAFALCDSLTEILVDEENRFYSHSEDGVLFNKGKTELLCYPGGKAGAYTIPDSVTSIGHSAFRSCRSLTGVEIPDSVTSIGDVVFAYCDSLTSVEIPDSITSIGDNAFLYCDSLSEITFKGDAPNFGDDVFYDVTATAYYPAGNETWTEEVRQNYHGEITWAAYETGPAVIASGTCGTNLTWTLDEEGTLTISGTGAMKSYESFGDAPWYTYANDILSVVIEDGVTNIGSNAFNRCGSMTSVNIPDSVTTIEASAFNRCIALTSIAIPDSVTSIEGFAFYDCRSLTTVTIPDSVTVIENLTFALCDGLTSIIIPDSITKIGYEAFRECTGLTEIVIPDSVKTIDEGAFYYCTNLRKVVIPNGVMTIDEGVFRSCTSLTEIVIPESVVSIGNYAFIYCTSLTEIEIPDSVTSIGYEAFYGCTGLTKITFQGDAPTFNSSAFYNVKVTAYYPADNVTWTSAVRQNYGGTITWVAKESYLAEGTCGDNLTWTLTKDGLLTISGEGAMYNYDYTENDDGDDTWTAPWAGLNISSVIVNDGVTYIGVDAFHGDGLEQKLDSVILSDSVKSVGSYAFYLSEANITMSKSLTSVGSYGFYGCQIDRLYNKVNVGKYGFANASFENGDILVGSTSTYSFAFSHGLNEVVVYKNPESYSFQFADLKKLILTDDITIVGEEAFRYCSELTGIYYCCNNPTIQYAAYSNGASGKKIYRSSAATGFADSVAVWPDEDHATVEKKHVDVTCEQYGYTVYGCAYCDFEYEQFNGAATGHTEVIDEGVDATCITDGKTEGKHCSVCGEVLVAQEVIPGGHTVENGICTRCKGYGTCGENLTWTLDAEGTLIISGTGAMDDYMIYSADAPWHEYQESVKTVIIEDGVTSIGEFAFNNHDNLAEVTIPDSVTEIGDHAFINCDKLTTVEIPDSVTRIENAVFFDCDGLTAVVIPDSVTAIDTDAFYHCSGLTELTIGSSVEEIGTTAFGYCRNLTEIVIPDSVTNIALGAFSGCSSLESITIPFVGGSAKTADDTNQYPFGYIFGTNSYDGLVATNQFYYDDPAADSRTNQIFYIPASLKTVTVTGGEILLGAFSNCINLTEIVLPEELTAIGVQAFDSCSSLKSMSIPKTVTDIGEGAFRDCVSLKAVILPAGLKAIAKETFSNCSSLAQITIPNAVTAIGEYAFYCCSNLTDVTFGNGVTEIGYRAFYGCESIASLNLGAAVVSIGEAAFESCTGLQTVTFPDGLETIGSYAFCDCRILMDVVIPETVTAIGDFAFRSCKTLNKFFFEGNAPQIAEYSFDNVTAKAYYPAVDETWTEEVRQNHGGNITWVAYYEGDCGENLRWLYSEDGYLTISGSGAMDNYATATECPWYVHRAGVQYLTVENGVTTIGDRAFYSCTALTEVSIGNMVTSIGSYAFRGCSALESVTIPASVTEIKASAFRVCSALAEVTFKGDAPAVGSYAFNECAANLTVNCYEGKTGFDAAPWTDMNVVVNHVGQWIVDKKATCTTDGSRHIYCSYCQETITETIIGKHNYVEGICSVCNEVELIDSGKSGNMTWKLDVFGTLTISGSGSMNSSPWRTNYKEQILHIVIEEGITSIGNSAFSGCSSLTEIVIPESVTTIGGDAFYNCSGLTEIVIPESVTSIGGDAFNGCSSLTEIVIPDSVTSIGSEAFRGCTGLTQVTIGSGVTSIGNAAFYGCTGLTEIVIPDSVTGIDDYAFYNCTGLTDVVIGSGVTTIGGDAFYNCSNLTEIVIPESVTTIGGSAFRDCIGLKEIEIPDGVTSIGNSAFYNCTSLTEIEIPDGVTSIGEYTFFNCSSLREIEIPESVTSIGYEAFCCCTGLTDVVIGSGVTSIGDSAFRNCSSLTEIVIPNSVTGIGNRAFDGCTSLTEIEIPDGVTSIGEFTFYDCSSLTEIVIPDSVTSIGPWAFSGCSSLTNVTIGSGMMTIGNRAFQHCTGLTEIVIPESVTSIGYEAFSHCTGLRNVTIGSGVTTVGDYAFRVCTGLREITFEGDAPVFSDSYVFSNVNATAYYPANNETWTSDVMKNYGGVITWMAACINGHGEVIDEGVEATCTTDGKTEGSHCSVCGTVLVAQETIPATGHANAQEVAEKASTCKTRGIKLHYHCEACGGDYLEKTVSAQAQTAEDLRLPLDETNHEGETEVRDALMESCDTAGYTGDIYCLGCQEKIETGEVIPPRHTLREVAEVAPTYDAEGTMAHYLCEKCGKLFADEAATEELTEEALRLEKLIPIPEQLAAAKPGDVVKLMADAAVDMAIVNEGVTLDLNGYTLTADYFVAFNGANVEDNSDGNTGLLKVPANRVMISKSNAQLPVWNGEGYVFSKVTYRKALVAHNADMVKFAFLPQFQSVATELLKDGFEGNKVTVEVRVSWETIQGREYRNLVFNNDQVALGISSGGAFILTFSGFSQLNLTTDVAIEAVVYSETGVSVASEAIVVDVTGE